MAISSSPGTEPEKNSADETLMTRILDVRSIVIPRLNADESPRNWYEEHKAPNSDQQMLNLMQASKLLRTISIPVAFPTETVYGLGADATRSEAVRGIYKAKQRPSDNPLIVHVGDLDHLRRVLTPKTDDDSEMTPTQAPDPIPEVYKDVIDAFWPGPLTLIFKLPSPSPFAPEVNSGLSTVGIRMPESSLTRLLILHTDRPLAAPSANLSGRPSPTRAHDVLNDLNGRIEIILDGGSCSVGVESTVLDGISEGPPSILRPGGIGLEDIRSLGGRWAKTRIAYNQAHAPGNSQQLIESTGIPRAPGMKYRHYSPKASVYLTTSSPSPAVSLAEALKLHNSIRSSAALSSFALICTSRWTSHGIYLAFDHHVRPKCYVPALEPGNEVEAPAFVARAQDFTSSKADEYIPSDEGHEVHVVDIGSDILTVARNMFGALRFLDSLGVDHIIVEGLDAQEGRAGGLVEAVMERLGKAADSGTRIVGEVNGR